jgi:S13-like H2TH domain
VRHEVLHEKCLENLARASAVRLARARLKRGLKVGSVEIEDVIARPPSFAEQAKVADLLLALPGIGPVRTTGLLVRCQIPYGRTLTSLSERQRALLIALVRS